MRSYNPLKELGRRKEEYKGAFPNTWQSDLEIARELEKGRSVLDIAYEIPCSTANVYKVIGRIRQFLFPGFTDFEIIQNHLLEKPFRCGTCGADSVLDMVFSQYEDFNTIDSEDIRTGYFELQEAIGKLPHGDAQNIMDLASQLCRSHEVAAFKEGMKAGVKMGTELYS